MEVSESFNKYSISYSYRTFVVSLLPYSFPSAFLPSFPAIFSAPKLASPTAITPTSLVLSWSIAPSTPSTGRLIGFVVRYRIHPHDGRRDESSEEITRKKRRKNDVPWIDFRTGSTNHSTVLSGLSPHTKYEVTVAGETIDTGIGHPSNVIVVRMEEEGETVVVWFVVQWVWSVHGVIFQTIDFRVPYR